MSVSVELRTQSTSDNAPDSVLALWSELKSYLERRSNELSEEVRNYPTPIARCDEQLTKLIEQRTRAIHQLKRVTESGPIPSDNAGQKWRERLGAFLASREAVADDEIGTAILSRLRAALSEPRDKG